VHKTANVLNIRTALACGAGGKSRSAASHGGSGNPQIIEQSTAHAQQRTMPAIAFLNRFFC